MRLLHMNMMIIILPAIHGWNEDLKDHRRKAIGKTLYTHGQ